MRLPIHNKIKRCALCNALIYMDRYDERDRHVHIMKRDNICYNCAYWTNLSKYRPEHFEVFNGEAIIAYPIVAKKSDKTVRLGSGGDSHYFLRTDRSLVASNDIWKYGKIPPAFRHLFPDTVIEISKMAHHRLRRNPRVCHARGCLDRYSCLRYDISDEQRYGAYNKIPKNWCVGNEKCKQFVNNKLNTK